MSRFSHSPPSAGLPALSVEAPQSNVYSSANQINTWSYDDNGNLQSIAGMQRTFTYDAENRQLTATINGAPTSYAYDGDGRRVTKTTQLGTTTYVYDAMGRLAAEYGPSTGDSGTTYLTSDHLGSTRLAVNPNWTKCYDFFPFGGDIPSSVNGRPSCYPSAPDPAEGLTVKFTSKERDAETGLDYFGARYYSSAQGRFTSPDWSARPQPVPYADLTNPQSLNLYNYMRNNPLSGADPDGHCDWNCFKQFASGVADTTYRPIVQAVSHPVDTVVALGGAVAHPLDTAVAVKNAVVQTGTAALSGDPKAIGQVTGTVISAVATAGVGKAATSLVQGAEVGEAAASTTLFRAVGSAEAESIGTTGAFTNPYGTELKGFFFNQSDAQSFGSRMTQMTGDTHTVVSGEAPTSLVNGAIPHSAATEGPGVYFKSGQLPQVKVKLPEQP